MDANNRTEEEQAERRALIDGLREFATFLENNDNAPTPLGGMFDVFVDSKEALNAARTAVGGHLSKRATDNYFYLRRMFGPIKYDLNVAREVVCERIVLGTRVVEAVPEHEEEVIEWKCGEVLR